MAEEQRNEDRTESEDWFDKIHRKLQEKGIRVPYDKDELKTTLTNLDQEKMDKVKSCLEGIGQSIVKMASDDPAQQMSGALDLVAAVTVFIPHVGPVISGVCLLISNVIMAFGGKGEGTSIAAELEQVVEKVVGKYHDDDVKAEAAGVKFKLQNMQTYLDGYTKTDPNNYTHQDAVDLARHDLEYTNAGAKCLGKLEHYIKQYAINKDSEDEKAVERQARCTLDYIEAYLELSSIRKLLLSVYCCILLTARPDGEFLAKTTGLLETIRVATEKEREIAGIVPTNFTTPDKAVLASVFYLSEHPILEAFGISRTPIALDGRTVQIIPKKWPNRHMYMNRSPAAYGAGGAYVPPTYKVTGSERQNSNTCFSFENAGDVIGVDIFTCKSVHKTEPYNLPVGITKEGNFGFTGDNNRGWFDLPGDKIKLIRLFDMHQQTDRQLYLITVVKYPAKFVYLTDDGWIKSGYPTFKVGDPGEQGYWYLDQAGAEAAQSRSDCTLS